MYQQFWQPESSPSDIWSTNYMEPAYHNAPFTSPPNPFQGTPYWHNLIQPHAQGNNMPQCTTAETQTADAYTQIPHDITTQQQQEIDHQLASRLQEVEIARVQNRPVQHPVTKESGSQYNLRDLQNMNRQQDRQNSPRQMEPTHVGSTSQAQQTDRNTTRPPPPPPRQQNLVNTPVSRYNRSNLDHQDQYNYQDHTSHSSTGFVPHYSGQQ